LSEHFATFVIFFSVIDPIGTVPVFLAVTSRFDTRARRRIAVRATLVATAVLVFFVVGGEVILTAMGIPLAAFQIAGGIVLFLFALSMIFGESKPEEELKLVTLENDRAVFPLAVPSLAGPGAMLTAVLLTENSRFSIWEQALTTAIMLLVLAIALVLMLTAERVHGLIGNSGASVISRVMGLILTAAAVTSVLAGIDAYFEL
jgi:multiple antibiotic resistance protein